MGKSLLRLGLAIYAFFYRLTRGKVGGNLLVIRALLQNPRLTEEDALAIATDKHTPGPVLRVLAEDPRFAPRPTIMKAVARNPETPAQTALRLLQHLGSRDLRDLMRLPKVPGLVRVAAQRILEARRAPDRAGRG